MKAHNIEMMVVSCHGKFSSPSNSRKDKGKFKTNAKFPKSLNKGSMAILTEELVRISGKSKYEN